MSKVKGHAYMRSMSSLVSHAVDAGPSQCNSDDSDRESYVDPFDETAGKEDALPCDAFSILSFRTLDDLPNRSPIFDNKARSNRSLSPAQTNRDRLAQSSIDPFALATSTQRHQTKGWMSHERHCLVPNLFVAIVCLLRKEKTTTK